MAECDISSSDLATAFTSSSMNSENVNSDLKKRKTHRLKQRFQVVKKLGQGTYGKVQLAINNETGQEVAIKTIKKNKVSTQQDLVRIRREIQIMSSINHPNIIHIFEVFENKDKIVLVMQYANGGELYDYVSYHKHLSDTEARRVFRQIATAIYYCHKNKICHRDLKLENILLDEKGNAKIADFGLSNVFDDKHFLQTFCGSPLYASPEIVRGLPYFGPEVDCWSLGVLLYTLVYGAMPFDGSNFKKLVKQISEASYFEPQEKSAASNLIHKLLTPDPKERASIIDICTDEWVNQDSEHSLLQVAEDLSNLTNHAVRLDLLLALAPGSPGNEAHPKPPKPPQTETEAEAEIHTNKRPIDESTTSANDSSLALDSPSQPPETKTKSSKKKSKKSTPTKMTETPSQVKQEDGMNSAILNESKEVEMEQKPESIQKQQSDKMIGPEIQQQPPENLKTSEAKLEDKTDEAQTSLKSNESTGSTSSLTRKRGIGRKVSIPKIWTETNQPQSSSQPDTPKISSPGLFSVSELRRELEQKTKMNQQQQSVRRRDTLADTSELKSPKTIEHLKKYKNRSISLNLFEIQTGQKTPEIAKTDSKMKSENEQSTSKEEIETSETKPLETPSEKEKDQPPSKTSSTSSVTKDASDISLAKQIIQKNIAKAKLMEKRQTSVASTTASGETTPLISIENSTISVTQDNSGSANMFFKPSTNMNESKNFNDAVASTPSTPATAVPIASAAPITRSYKKVIFTKDGAKITETGKFYSHEGDDGVTTRVKTKSRITHIINNGNNNEANNGTTTTTLQRSDSQSSTGSIDIFDDIFDDHWTGENLFSNVKSLFNDFFGRPLGKERMSLRSRAESLERTATNFPGGSRLAGSSLSEEQTTNRRNNIRDIIDKNSGNLFSSGSQKSLFTSTSKSIFSSSSLTKSAFEKDIDDFMNSSRSKIENCKRQALSGRFSDDRGDDFFSSRSRLFDSFDNNRQDSSDSARKRIEQWLDDSDHQQSMTSDWDSGISTYGTMPRSRRYSRTMTSNDYKSDVVSKVEISNTSSRKIISQKTSTIRTENLIPRNSEIQLNFKLDDSIGNLILNDSNISVSNQNQNEATTSTNRKKIQSRTSQTASASQSGTSLSDLKLEEPSSLLEQLRAHGGYKKLIDRKLSNSSSTEDDAAMAESFSTMSNKSSAMTNSEQPENDNLEKKTKFFMRKRIDNNDMFHDETLLESNNVDQHHDHFGDLVDNNRNRIRFNDRNQSNIDSLLSSNTSETVQERIHRKSFYSRFNSEFSTATSSSSSISSSCRQRRRSLARTNNDNFDDYITGNSTSKSNTSNYYHTYNPKRTVHSSNSVTSYFNDYNNDNRRGSSYSQTTLPTKSHLGSYSYSRFNSLFDNSDSDYFNTNSNRTNRLKSRFDFDSDNFESRFLNRRKNSKLFERNMKYDSKNEDDDNGTKLEKQNDDT